MDLLKLKTIDFDKFNATNAAELSQEISVYIDILDHCIIKPHRETDLDKNLEFYALTNCYYGLASNPYNGLLYELKGHFNYFVKIKNLIDENVLGMLIYNGRFNLNVGELIQKIKSYNKHMTLYNKARKNKMKFLNKYIGNCKNKIKDNEVIYVYEVQDNELLIKEFSYFNGYFIVSTTESFIKTSKHHPKLEPVFVKHFPERYI